MRLVATEKKPNGPVRTSNGSCKIALTSNILVLEMSIITIRLDKFAKKANTNDNKTREVEISL